MGVQHFSRDYSNAWDRYYDSLITRGNQDGSAVAVAQPSAPPPDASAPHEPLVSPALTQDQSDGEDIRD